jgi:hypothetical protein
VSWDPYREEPICETESHEIARQGIMHLPVAVLQADGAVQSVSTWQPQVPAKHALPFRLPVQFTQAPDRPHAVLPVPGSHALVVPQQPALHGSPGQEQEKTHRPMVLSHPALFGGHWVALVHPHRPPPATGSHALPEAPEVNPAVQDAQSRPVSPQAVATSPFWHVPSGAPAQQPSLQG